MTLDEAKAIAKEVSEGKSRSYVQAAHALATFVLERADTGDKSLKEMWDLQCSQIADMCSWLGAEGAPDAWTLRDALVALGLKGKAAPCASAPETWVTNFEGDPRNDAAPKASAAVVREGDRIMRVGDVLIETVEGTGWSVFTGCDGEEAHFHAFFRRRADAEQYLAMCAADPDSDAYLCDPDVAPSVVFGEILAANHFDFAQGAAALAKAADLTSDEAKALRDEAALSVGAESQEKTR